MKPSEFLHALITPSLRFPKCLTMQAMGSAVVIEVAKSDFRAILGKNGSNLEALKLIMNGVDNAQGRPPAKIILQEPVSDAHPGRTPQKNVAEKAAQLVAALILQELREPVEMETVRAGDQIHLVSDAELPADLRQAISRWCQMVSMSNGGGRVVLTTPADVR